MRELDLDRQRKELEGSSFSWRSVIGSALCAAIGSALWVVIALAADEENSWGVAAVGLLTGFGARMGRWAGAATGAVAAGWALLAILIAKMVYFSMLEGAAPIEVFSYLDLFDVLFIGCAMGIAFFVGSGQYDFNDFV